MRRRRRPQAARALPRRRHHGRTARPADRRSTRGREETRVRSGQASGCPVPRSRRGTHLRRTRERTSRTAQNVAPRRDAIRSPPRTPQPQARSCVELPRNPVRKRLRDVLGEHALGAGERCDRLGDARHACAAAAGERQALDGMRQQLVRRRGATRRRPRSSSARLCDPRGRRRRTAPPAARRAPAPAAAAP